MLFVGCSLDNELDLLYSAGMQLEQRAKLNKEHHIIYLLYSEGNVEVNTLGYKKYGITDIIIVNRETVIELYELIYSINKRLGILHDKDLLQEYTNIKFEYLDGRNKENIDYLFYNDKVKIKNGIIKFPAFFVERSCIKKVQEEILSGKGIFHIIYGTKFSGKTYALLQLLKNVLNRRMYYFPSYITLSDDIIENLTDRDGAIFLIDDGAITFEQYKGTIVPKLSQFEKKNIRIVLIVSKGDVDFYKYYKNFQKTENESIKLYELDNKFDTVEQKVFNEKIGDISLVPYNNNETILDYLFKVEDNMLRKRQKMILPRVNFLSNDREKEVRSHV